MKQNIIIVGAGETGQAIYQLEKKAGNLIKFIDPAVKTPESTLDKDKSIDVVHICFGFSQDFVTHATFYATEYKPKLMIINSTVSVGTTQTLRDAVQDTTVNYIVNSPIRGVHPKLVKGIKTFVKYVGGKTEDAKVAIEHFKTINVEAEYLGSYETTELSKILSTSYYGWNILFAKEADLICRYYGVDFDDVYTKPNESYNRGYKKLGMSNVVRPILVPPEGKIGGHCITPNFKLLPSKNTLSDLARVFKELDDK